MQIETLYILSNRLKERARKITRRESSDRYDVLVIALRYTEKTRGEDCSDEYHNLCAQRYAYSILLLVTEVANGGYYVE